MCGIVGFANGGDEKLLDAFNRTQAHRGPDGIGTFFDPSRQVGLAMCRLSILDLEGGIQPMSNVGKTTWVIFNGEIYNSPDLRTSLLEQGSSFRSTNSDTECLVHLYDRLGPEMLNKLNGMFSFVIYDKSANRLFGARDRFGIKPLYYLVEQGRFYFSSEIKALLSISPLKREINLQSLHHYLSLRYVPGEESIFAGIKRLPPGHFFVFDLNTQELSVKRYWSLEFHSDYQTRAEDWPAIIREELGNAVQRWTLSDVPIGCSLSGGLDSTSIVALLAQRGYTDLRTYTVGFTGAGEADLDELDLARELADRVGTQHHELTLDAEALLADLPQMVWSLDEPYGGGLPSWQVFKFMAQDVKVGLTGTGGDEIFGGYGKWMDFMSLGPWQKARRFLQDGASALPEALLGAERKSRLAKRRITRLSTRLFDYYPYYFNEAEKQLLGRYSDGFSLVGTADHLQDIYMNSCGAPDPRNGIACVDMQTQLPEEFLLMSDRFSMAHSLEARTPFLDHVFVERMMTIPPELRTRPQDLKYLLRAAVTPLLPTSLLRGPKKGFVLPIRLWLEDDLQPLLTRYLSRDYLENQGLFSADFVDGLLVAHQSGKIDLAWQLWNLLMFQLWYEIFINQHLSQAPNVAMQEMI